MKKNGAFQWTFMKKKKKEQCISVNIYEKKKKTYCEYM